MKNKKSVLSSSRAAARTVPLRSTPAAPHGDFSGFSAGYPVRGVRRLSPALISRALDDADQGRTSALSALFRDLLEKEPVMAAHIQTRILSVLSCDWSIRADDPRKAREVEQLLRRAGIVPLMRHLLDALAFGFSGAATIWEPGGDSIACFRHIHPMNWCFSASGEPALVSPDGSTRALSAFPPEQFIFHTHMLKSDSPARCGLLRPLLWLCYFKHISLKDRARYLERFGIPFLIAKISDQEFDAPDTRGSILESLAKMGSDGVGVLTEGADLQIVSSSSAASSGFQSWMDYIDRMAALLILGQTASSGAASGFSKGQPQENVRRDLIEADCTALMETIDRQILMPLERWKYGSVGTLSFLMDYSSPENLLEKAQIVQTLAGAGFRFSPEWLARTFSIEAALPNPAQNQP